MRRRPALPAPAAPAAPASPASPATDAADADANARRRQPFRPLQSLRPSHSPALPTKSTPPREIILTPRATPKPVKRKATSRPKRPTTKVKSEPPEIDLSKVRPPSPSDDPLLLSGTPPAMTRSPPLHARLTPIFSSPSDATCIDPPFSFTSRLFDSGKHVPGSRFASGSTPDSGDNVLPMFGAPRTVAEASDAWSDSDDDGLTLTGEYTGKYKLLKVLTKGEPPARAASWGRPVSPFPYSEKMERSLPLSELGEENSGREDVLDVMVHGEDVDVWEAATEPPPSDVELSPLPLVSEDEFAALDDDFPVIDLYAESLVRSAEEPRETCSNSDQTSLEEEEEEEEAQIDRELSVLVDDGPDTTISKTVQPMNVMEDGSSDEEDGVEGEDIVKITSDDPKAAARAAAILRMHDYDCILAAEKKKRVKSKRRGRKTIDDAGITKSYSHQKSQRWQALQGIETSPGSRSFPLLELWRDAEDSVFLEHHSMSYCDTSFTLSPLKTKTTRPEPLLPPPTGEWTSDCWKSLDKCLVSERLAVAAAHDLGTDLLADIGDVSKDAILDRFVRQVGGESVLASLGSGWSRDDLMLRLDVLIKKQARRVKRAQTSARRDATEPRYRGLLEEAMALSVTTTEYTTSLSALSDTSLDSDRLGARKGPQMLQDPEPEPGWQTRCVRSPIRTPSRTPDPRHPHPKDQVCLKPMSLPQESRIPVPIRPKRLIDLRHRSPAPTRLMGVDRPTTRRSSGCSVRDLVKQFESLDQ